ncbi:MAG: flagellar biosynthesis protein FlhF [Rhodothermaceae bacterium]
MQIKKYTAHTLKEAMEKMKLDLGGEAVVLSTKVLNKNAKEKLFEITAGIEHQPEKEVSVKKEEKYFKENKHGFTKELEDLSKKIIKEREEFRKRTDTVDRTISDDLSQDFDEILEILTAREIDLNNARKVIEQLHKYEKFLNKENLDQYVISTLGAMIPTEAFEINKNSRPNIISLVGPTGVGKTTCIAKLAVISKILHNLDIGLITIDTYRLGAIDQLKIFSEISNIDFLVAYDPDDLRKSVDKFKKKDIVFIDTVGRSQNNTALLQDIKKILSVVNIDETYLVLNSSTASRNLIDIASKFEVLNYDAFIFTKLDEAVSFGSIFNVVNAFNKPIKYLTNGQVIPDDIIAADSEFISNLIYTGKIHQ